MAAISEAKHREARAKARAVATAGDWLSLVLLHHEQIEAAFADVKLAATEPARQQAQKHLAILLTGHSNAEESVLYPALSRAGEQGGATTAYSEQAVAKQEMGKLEVLAPSSAAYLEKLEHIREAVARHMWEEESDWFLTLKEKGPAAEQATLARRYQEEFDRYVGSEVASPSGRPAMAEAL